MRRRLSAFVAATVLAAGALLGVTAGPASATCYIGTTTTIEIYEAFQCETPAGWKSIQPTSAPLPFCRNLHTITDAAHPAPNGWGNTVSSVNNQTNYAIAFYDAFSCAGPVLFAMDGLTARPTLVPAANNKSSSIYVTNRFYW